MDTFLSVSAAWPLNFWSTDDNDLNRGTNLGRVGITRCNLHAQHPPAWSRLVVTPFLISLFFLSFFGSGPWIQSWSHLWTKPDTLKRKHENACNCLMAPSSSTPWDVPRLFELFELFITFAGEGAPLKCRRTSTAVEQTNRPEGYFASRGAGCETGGLCVWHYATMCLPLSFGLSPSLSFSLKNIANNAMLTYKEIITIITEITVGQPREKVLEVLHQPWQCYSRKTDSDVSASVIW